MKMNSLVTGTLFAAALLLSEPVRAQSVLLEKTNTLTGSNGVDQALTFTATGTATTITIAGYNEPFLEYVSNIHLTGGADLFQNWYFTAASSGSLAGFYPDGTSVSALIFGAYNMIDDSFYQSVATTVGNSYTLNFNYNNSMSPSPSHLIVTEFGNFAPITQPSPLSVGPASSVPEISTWSMLLLGFLGLGFARGRLKKNGRAVI